jgi:hypothetical protein
MWDKKKKIGNFSRNRFIADTINIIQPWKLYRDNTEKRWHFTLFNFILTIECPPSSKRWDDKDKLSYIGNK